jgi:Protein of unknown function (DUF2846)
MQLRILVLSVIAMFTFGCAATRDGADFVSLTRSVGPPKAGNARIVVLREKAYAGVIDQGWSVLLDGEPMGELKTGTYLYADRPAGQHELSVKQWDFPGVTRRSFTLASGRTYFFLTILSDRGKAISAATSFGGLTGFAVASIATSGDTNLGPVDFVPMEETAARQTITELRQGK